MSCNAMWSTPNPRRRLCAYLSVTVIVTIAMTVWSAWWAFRTIPDPDLHISEPPSSSVAVARPHVDLEHWSAILWRPFSDKPDALPVAVAVPTAKLFSILHRNGAKVAVLDIGSPAGLIYVKAGETVSGVTVASIDAHSVDILIAGRSQHLALTP